MEQGCWLSFTGRILPLRGWMLVSLGVWVGGVMISWAMRVGDALAEGGKGAVLCWQDMFYFRILYFSVDVDVDELRWEE